MAHPIRRDETIPHAIRRVARRDLGKARDEIADSRVAFADRIHDLRTAIKKVRALARMVRPHDRPAAKEDRRLRKLAQAASPVREAEVLLHTFDELARGQIRGDGTSDSLRLLRSRFATRLRDATQAFTARPGLGRMRKRLARARRRTKHWTPTSDRWRTIGAGLVQGYERAQQRMAQAYRRMTGDAFHAWRRATKSHRHQLHALLELAPELRPRVDQLDRLGDLLGDEHDLTVLAAALERERPHDTTGTVGKLLADLDRRRSRLRTRARRLGNQLFAGNASQLAARLRQAFRSSRKG